MPLANPIPGPPASVLSAALVAAPAFGPSYNQSGRATINGAGPSYPDLPSLMTDVVSMTGSATLDMNMLVTGLFGSQGWATQGVTTVTGNYTPLPTDAVILTNAAGGAVTVTLPDATGPGYVPGQRYTVKKTDSSVNAVTVATSAGQLIDGASTVTLTAANSETSVVFDGVVTDNWWAWSGITSLAAGLVNPTSSKTANYNAAPADFVICNITAGGFTVTLPSAPANGTVIGAKVVSTNGTNTLTVACSGADVFDVPSGSTTRTVILLDQASLFQYFATPKIWYGLASNLPLADLDGRYVTQSTLTTLGDTLYENATPAPARLAGNTTTTKNFLTQTGNGTVSAAPAWGTVAAGDLPAATTSTQGAVILDGTAADIQPTGNQGAGAVGKAADAGHIHPATFWVPADNSLVAASSSPDDSGNASGALGAGTLYLAKIPIRYPFTAGTVWWVVSSASSGTSSGSHIGLYNSAGSLLPSSDTGEIGAKFSATGAQSAALGAAQSLTAGFVWAGMVVNFGTTQPGLRSYAGGQAGVSNMGLAASAYRSAVNGTALSTLPGTLNPASNAQSGANPLLFGLA